MITFGGDGTLLRAAHICAERGTPILGVYFGRFGFVTQCMPEEVGAAISQFLDGKIVIDERMMVQTDLMRGERIVATLHSLNESAVQRSATTRILTFEVLVNGRLMSRYPADGVMVATPTGSTAYSLSAGGPVVDPKLETMLITALLPHTLSARPLVVRPDAVIEIAVESQGDAVLSCDGQSRLHLLTGDRVYTSGNSRAELQFDFANLLRLGPMTEVRMGELADRHYEIHLASGLVMVRVNQDNQAQFEIDTPSISIRPTRRGSYRIEVLPDGTSEITVRSGEAEIFSPQGSETLGAESCHSW